MKYMTGLSINLSHRKVTTPSSRDNGPISLLWWRAPESVGALAVTGPIPLLCGIARTQPSDR